ncbi:MAG: transposase [Planctomycetota bacterium]
MDAALFSDLACTLPLAEAAHVLLCECLDRERLTSIYEKHRGRSYERIISFPVMVELISDSLMNQGGSACRTFSRAQEVGDPETSRVAAYRKLGRTPIPLSMAFFTECNQNLLDTFTIQARRDSPQCLQSLETVILDGRAIKSVAKQMRALRAKKGGRPGGRALIALHHGTGRVVGLHAWADDDADDSCCLPELLPVIQQRINGPILWLADGGFCTHDRLEDFARNGHHFLIQYQKTNSFHADSQGPAVQGTDQEGRTYTEEWGWLGAEDHENRRYSRRITLICPKSYDVILVTDLLDGASFPAADLLEHYLSRCGIKGVFRQVTEIYGLEGLISSRPEAAIFQFAFCLLLYNVLQVTRGFIAAS